MRGRNPRQRRRSMNGIFSALLGVFNADGDINEDGVRALVRHNIDKCGIDGLYVNGSTGETFLMTMEMRKKVLRAVADEAKGQVSLIAHVGGICLDDVNELSKKAADLGYDAISAVTPFYYKFTPDELRLYYTNIAEKSALPLIAYYIPSLTGVTMSIDNLCSILDTPNVSGLKFTSNDFFALERLRTARPEKLIFSGFDEMLLPMTVLGTNGAIGSTYNIIGHWAKKIYELASAGKLDEARVWQQHVNYVVSEVNNYGLYGTLKAVCTLYGIPAGNCKAPMAPISFRQREAARRIKDYMEKVK